MGRPGEGPGDFAFADYVFPDDTGFLVRDLQRGRFSYFSREGALLTTADFPGNVSYQGFRIDAHARFPDGSFLGKPSIAASVEVGFRGTSTGDTVWQRRLQFDPVPVAGSVLDAPIDVLVGMLEHLEEIRPGVLGRRSPHAIVDEALFVPEHLPAVGSIFLSSFSGVWIESLERVDTMTVWYSLARLLAGCPSPPVEAKLSVEEIAELVCVGGWPGPEEIRCGSDGSCSRRRSNGS